jgi:hypothetical protein
VFADGATVKALAFRPHKAQAGRKKRIAAFAELLKREGTIYPQGR